MTPEISVCILTYARPKLLGRCLESLQHQQCSGFAYSVLVVDNDANESARGTVELARRKYPVALRYCVEPVRSISLARNRAVAESRADFVAFIDDDERAEQTWLSRLFATLVRYSSDGVLGPVLPDFEAEPPKWLVKSGLCDRESFETGTRLVNPKFMRTGNVLFARRIVAGEKLPFDPKFGRTGGEDTDFFSRMLRAGRAFTWCNEARVHESVPAERQKRSYFVRLALVRGMNTASRQRLISVETAKSVVAVFAYALAFPFLLVLGHAFFMKSLVSACHHAAKLFAHFGIRLARERTS